MSIRSPQQPDGSEGVGVPQQTDAFALFSPGQLIRHRRFGYRGVVVDVDATFQLSDEWYEEIALSRPPKDRPWYRILVDESETATYVAERHLECEPSLEPIRHPLLHRYFCAFHDGRYEVDSPIN